jgi:photosystem II stability/assembly factor-like uncharacterized protein
LWCFAQLALSNLLFSVTLFPSSRSNHLARKQALQYYLDQFKQGENMKHFTPATLSAMVLTFVTLFPIESLAQAGWANMVIPPQGDAVVGSINIPFKGRIYWSKRQLIFEEVTLGGFDTQKILNFGSTEAMAEEDDIMDVHYKKENHTLFILTKKGKIYGVNMDDRQWHRADVAQNDPYESFSKIKGDALYMLTTQRFLVSRDDGATWQPDTAGLSKINPKSFDLDSLQYVYIAHSLGILRQHPDSMTWNRLSSFPGTMPSVIFIDKKQRIFVSGTSPGRIYLSTDRGDSWSIDSAGMFSEYASSFGEDLYGNVYAISGDAKRIFRSTGGTERWTRIDQPISNLVPDQSIYDTYARPLFKAINGDSILYVSTAVGAFSSKDQGATWQEKNTTIDSYTFFGFLKTPKGRTVIQTTLGVYCKDETSSVWTKTYPANGYFTAPANLCGTLFRDAPGNIYALGARINTSQSTSPYTPMKSSDDGKTWAPDTSGFVAIGNGSSFQYFVDETGTSYMTSSTMPGRIAVKKQGQNWAIDSAGFMRGLSSRSVISFSTDKQGSIYLGTGGGLLLTRPISGGTWMPDTVGLGTDQIFSMAADKAGNFYVGGLNTGLRKKSVSGWQSMSLPQGLSGCYAHRLSIDSTGALFAVFADWYNWRGVYSTTDGGTTWRNCGFDKLGMNLLVSYGDTTYVVTQAKGIAKLTRSSGTGFVMDAETPSSYRLLNNYPNPFNPTTSIRYELAKESAVTIKIFDILGREIETLVNGRQKSGSHRIEWNARNAASGIYFYQMRADAFCQTKKMILQK